jgi:hypothetical protein
MEFKSAGTELNRMMDRLGFPDEVGDVYGAALDSAIGDEAGAARNLLDAYSPFTTGQLDSLTRAMSPAATMQRPAMSYAFRNPMQGYGRIYSAGLPGPATSQHLLNTMLNRLSPQNLIPVLTHLNNGIAPQANQSLPDALGSTIEMMLDRLSSNIEKKLDDQAVAAPMRKKKKKHGLGSKISKAFKKTTHSLTKSVTRFARKAFSDAFKTMNKSFSSFWRTLRSGNIFELGKTLAGGLVGGPVGGLVLDQVMKSAGAKNLFGKVFQQVQQSFDTVRLYQQHQAELQRSLLKNITGKFKL